MSVLIQVQWDSCHKASKYLIPLLKFTTHCLFVRAFFLSRKFPKTWEVFKKMLSKVPKKFREEFWASKSPQNRWLIIFLLVFFGNMLLYLIPKISLGGDIFMTSKQSSLQEVRLQKLNNIMQGCLDCHKDEFSIRAKNIFGGKFGNPSFCHINGMEGPNFCCWKKAGISFT